VNFRLCSRSIWPSTETVAGTEHGGVLAGHHHRRRPVRLGEQTTGGLRRHSHRISGPPRELRLHRGTHAQPGAEAGGVATGESRRQRSGLFHGRVDGTGTMLVVAAVRRQHHTERPEGGGIREEGAGLLRLGTGRSINTH
jgi:hypothetical protein